MKALVSSKRVALLHDEDNVVLFNNPLNIAVASSKIDLSMTTSSSTTTKKKNELFGLLQGGDENENVYAITKTGLVIDLNGKEIGTLKNKIYSIARQGGEKEFRYLCVARTKRATLALCSFELSKQKEKQGSPYELTQLEELQLKKKKKKSENNKNHAKEGENGDNTTGSVFLNQWFPSFSGGSATILSYKQHIILVKPNGKSTIIDALHEVKSLAFHETGTRGSVIAVGTSTGKIVLFYCDGESQVLTTSEVHWHANEVSSLCFSDENYLLSGGSEGVLCLWKLDTGSSKPLNFMPRLGAPILCIVSATPSTCLVLLRDSILLSFTVPALHLNKKVRVGVPKTATAVCYNQGENLLGFFVDEHLPGVLNLCKPVASTQVGTLERSLDVIRRNAVSDSDKKQRWRVETCKFSYSGQLMACIVKSGNEDSPQSLCRRELRVFIQEREKLRVALGVKDSIAQTSFAILDVTETSVGVVDSFVGASKLRVFSAIPPNHWGLERLFDFSPFLVQSFALSDDDSALAVRLNHSLARVLSRNGRLLRVPALPHNSHVVFGVHSLELFAWSESAVHALRSGVSYKLRSDGEVVVDAFPIMDSNRVSKLALLLRHDGLVHLSTVFHSNEIAAKERVTCVEPRRDWARVLGFHSAKATWLLQRQDGTIEARETRPSPTRKLSQALEESDVLDRRLIDDADFAMKRSDVDDFTEDIAPSLVGLADVKKLPSHLLPRAQLMSALVFAEGRNERKRERQEAEVEQPSARAKKPAPAVSPGEARAGLNLSEEKQMDGFFL